ncbi:MAG: hypothetical protein ACRDIE_09430, partial [Chloroflexota bacterium]
HAQSMATMGYALDLFRRTRNLSDSELASWLSIHPENLAEMAEMRRPEPDQSDFNLRCAEIARSTGSDAFALRTLLRWLRTCG